MSLEERAKRAVELADRPTRADRIFAIVAKLNPDAAAACTATGRWRCRVRPPWAGPTDEATAPYLIGELDDGTTAIQIISAEGDLIGATGATVDEALTKLEVKVG